jgi:TPR repeat protein
MIEIGGGWGRRLSKTRSIGFGTVCLIALALCSCGKSDQQPRTETALPQDYESGKHAYDTGDYERAYKIWLPLANQGQSGAQFFVGFLYEVGSGVKQDQSEAVKWFTLSADQGMGDAQARLCHLLMNGQGAPRDYVQAYKWATLGSELGNPQCQQTRSELEKLMKPGEIKEATRLAADWNAKRKKP